MDNTKPNSSWLKTFSIGFSIISFGITLAIVGYIVLTTKQNQPANQQPITTSPTISAVSPAPNGVGANWKTYISNQINISFQYPPEFRVLAGLGRGVFIDYNQTGGQPDRWLSINRSDKKDALFNTAQVSKIINIEIGGTYSVKDNKGIEIMKLQRVSDISINNSDAYVFEDENPYETPPPRRIIFVQHNELFYIFDITYSNYLDRNSTNIPERKINYVETFDQILSTFRFIE